MSVDKASDHPREPLVYQRPTPEQMRASVAAFLEVARRRRSVREFSRDDVPDDVIEMAIRCAATAPSGANMQPWKFVVVTGMNYAKFHGDDRIDRARHLVANNTALPPPYDCSPMTTVSSDRSTAINGARGRPPTASTSTSWRG